MNDDVFQQALAQMFACIQYIKLISGDDLVAEVLPPRRAFYNPTLDISYPMRAFLSPVAEGAVSTALVSLDVLMDSRYIEIPKQHIIIQSPAAPQAVQSYLEYRKKLDAEAEFESQPERDRLMALDLTRRMSMYPSSKRKN